MRALDRDAGAAVLARAPRCSELAKLCADEQRPCF